MAASSQENELAGAQIALEGSSKGKKAWSNAEVSVTAEAGVEVKTKYSGSSFTGPLVGVESLCFVGSLGLTKKLTIRD